MEHIASIFTAEGKVKLSLAMPWRHTPEQRYGSTHTISSLDGGEWSALPPEPPPPGVQIEGRLCPRGGPDGFVEDISYLCRDSNPGPSIPIFRARCYTGLGGGGGRWAEARLRWSSSVQDYGWSPVQFLYWNIPRCNIVTYLTVLW
jgi:hypothetical protein